MDLANPRNGSRKLDHYWVSNDGGKKWSLTEFNLVALLYKVLSIRNYYSLIINYAKLNKD